MRISSHQRVDYEWPVVEGFINHLLASKEEPKTILNKLKSSLDCKTLLVCEKKALMLRASEFLE